MSDVVSAGMIVALDRQSLMVMRMFASPSESLRRKVRLFSEFLPEGAPADVVNPWGCADSVHDEVVRVLEVGCRRIAAVTDA
jgi:protein-tyrosine-phosphatase